MFHSKSYMRTPLGPYYACPKCNGGREMRVSHLRKGKTQNPYCIKCGEKQQDLYYTCYMCVECNRKRKVKENYHKPKDLYYIKTHSKWSCKDCVGFVHIPAHHDLEANKLPTLEYYLTTWQANR